MIEIKRIYNTLVKNRDDIRELRAQYLRDPKSLLEMGYYDFADVKKTIEAFYRQQLDNTHLDGYVIGLSGGIDSALVATLAVEAVGADKVYGAILPSKYSAEGDIDIAVNLAEGLGIQVNDYGKVQSLFDPIQQMLSDAGEVNPDPYTQKIKEGNIQARMRMIMLRDIAKNRNSLVLGTTNWTENLMGYFTIGGDGTGGVDNEGICELPKTSERILAKYMDLDETIITKPPTAGLWAGQTDEEEFGMSYENLDLILVGDLLSFDRRQIVNTIGSDEVMYDDVVRIQKHVKKNMYKTQSVPQPYFLK